MERGIEKRRGEPWFAAAQEAIEEEQAGAFASQEELVANVKRQIPLYFHRWEGNEQAGLELAEDFARMEPLHYFNTVELQSFDLRGDLRTIAAPTLVLVGDDDFIAGRVCADAIVRELPGARLLTIPGAGHFTYVEQPEAKKVFEKFQIPTKTMADRVRHVVQSAFNGKRVLIFSGGEAKGTDEILQEVRGLRDGGAFGSIMGRNSFQRPREEGLKLLRDVMDIFAGRS